MKLVQIDWIDSAYAPSGWECKDDLESLRPVECVSIGFLVEDTPAYKTIAHSMNNNQVCGRITIPTSCIKRCRKLR